VTGLEITHYLRRNSRPRCRSTPKW